MLKTPTGHYEFLGKIASGGMAEIFKAVQFGSTGTERIVAIKQILPALSSDARFVEMLINEAKIAVLLTHANIVQTYELLYEGERYYLVMEFVEGTDLRRVWERAVQNRISIAVPLALHITHEIVRGLDYAHRRKDIYGATLGIIHRDVSPQNVLVSDEGEIKLTDFGIAKATEQAQHKTEGVLKGKFAYMSPEQARSEPLDHRTDLYSAAIMLFEMLTDHRLFLSSTPVETLDKVRQGVIPDPRELNPDLSQGAVALLQKALAQKIEDRFESGEAFAAAIQQTLHEMRAPAGSRLVQELMQRLFPPADRALEACATAQAIEVSHVLVTRALDADERKVLGVLEQREKRSTILVPEHSRPKRSAERLIIGLSVFLGICVALGSGWIVWSERMERRARDQSLAPRVEPKADEPTAGGALLDQPTDAESSASTDANGAATPPDFGRRRSVKQGKPLTESNARSVRAEGVLQIQIFPWASITLDGHRYGEQRAIGPISVRGGSHQIELAHPQYVAKQFRIDVKAGRVTTVRYNMDDPKPAIRYSTPEK